VSEFPREVAIDIRRITEFGIGRIRVMCASATRLDRESEYLLIGSPQRVEEMGPLPPNFQLFHCSSPTTRREAIFDIALCSSSQTAISSTSRTFRAARSLPCPYVLTVHDVLEHMSRTNGRSDIRRLLNFQLTRRALKGAARIFAVSQFTKSEIEKLFGIASDRIRVVYNAIDARFLGGHATAADRQFWWNAIR